MRFSPERAITRVQLATILARMARQFKGYPATATEAGLSEVSFTDVPDYAKVDVSLAAALGLMAGSDGSSGRLFQAWSGAARAQVAVAMTRYLDLPTFTAAGAMSPASAPADPAAEVTDFQPIEESAEPQPSAVP